MPIVNVGEYRSHPSDDRYNRTPSDLVQMRQVLDLLQELREQKFVIEYNFRNSPEGRYRFYYIEFDTVEEAIEFKLKYL